VKGHSGHRGRTVAVGCGRPMRRMLVAAGLVVAGVAAAPAGAAVPAIRVSPPRIISLTSPFSGPCTVANANFTHGISVETSVAVNPRNPNHILVAWIQDGASTDIIMASRDGGRSFSRILVPGLSACTGGLTANVSDPGVNFSSDGKVAYFSAPQADLLSVHPFKVRVGMAATRSLDGGFSWSNPFEIQPVTNDYWDKPELSVDLRRPRAAYYVFDFRTGADYSTGYSLISTTRNAGLSWSKPRKLYDPHQNEVWPGTSTILSNRDASLVDAFVLIKRNSAGGARLLAMRSTDHGRTWAKPITLGGASGTPVNDPVTQDRLETYRMFPTQTVAPNGDDYVAWVQPGATNKSSRLAVAKSTNGGRRWTVSGIRVASQAALPGIAVAGDGTVGLLYYTFAASSHGGVWPGKVMLATSRDRGSHWTSRQVAGPFNLLKAGSTVRGCCTLNDYVEMGRLPHGLVAAYPMAKPQARHDIDVFFTRIATSQ
jgi:hypothetical protein